MKPMHYDAYSGVNVTSLKALDMLRGFLWDKGAVLVQAILEIY